MPAPRHRHAPSHPDPVAAALGREGPIRSGVIRRLTPGPGRAAPSRHVANNLRPAQELRTFCVHGSAFLARNAAKEPLAAPGTWLVIFCAREGAERQGAVVAEIAGPLASNAR